MSDFSDAFGQALVTILVGAGTKAVAEKLGVDGGAASMLGLGAAMYMNSGVSSGGSETGAAGTAAGSVGPKIDPTIPTPSMDFTQPDPTQSTSILSGAPSASLPSSGGMLKPSAIPDPSMGAPGSVAPTPRPQAAGTDTAGRVIETETVGRTGGGSEQKTSWWEKVFSPQNTMDMVMSGIGGYAEAGMRKEELQMPYKREDELAKRWKESGTGGYLKMNPTYRSQGGSY